MLQKVTRRPGPDAAKTFQLNDILSLVSGLPLSSDGHAATYRLIAFVMETEATASHAAANIETVKHCLAEQLPFLAELDMTGLYQIYNYESKGEEIENPYLDVWMEMQALRYGAEQQLMPFRAWRKIRGGDAPAREKTCAGAVC